MEVCGVTVKKFWFKFEWAAWLNDRELHRCSLETRGFWIECIALMEESESWFVEGTMQQIANLIGCTPAVAKRCIDDLVFNKAAEIVKNGQNVKVASRRLMKAYNLREYNKLAKRKERAKKNVNVPSSGHSKDKSFRVLEEEREEEKRGDTPATFEPSVFEHPAVVVFEERFKVKTRRNFAEAIGRAVNDQTMGVWVRLIEDKISWADEPLAKRQAIAKWFMTAFNERLAKNPTPAVSYAHVRNQPTQRDAIAAEQARIAQMVSEAVQ